MVVVQELVKANPLFSQSFYSNMMYSVACLLSCSDGALVSEEKLDNKKTLVRISSSGLVLYSMPHLNFGLDTVYPDTVFMVFIVCSKQMLGLYLY
jgi:hypothetical protein